MLTNTLINVLLIVSRCSLTVLCWWIVHKAKKVNRFYFKVVFDTYLCLQSCKKIIISNYSSCRCSLRV